MSRLSGREIAEIARLLDDSQFTSLDLQMGDFRLRIRRDGAGATGSGWARTRDDGADDGDGDGIADMDEEISGPGTEPGPPAPATGGGNAEVEAKGDDEVDVEAPLLGNYYASPRPGEDPFVQVGDRVEPDTTIAIIEVMKLMNPIRAGVSGTVTAILAENGKAVEEGQPLIRVRV